MALYIDATQSPSVLERFRDTWQDIVVRAKLTLILPLAITACATAPAPALEIPGCRNGSCIHMGESQDFGSLRVTPLEVLEDSRCPIEADCIWEGTFRIKAQLDMGHESITVELKAYEPLAINGGTLTLAEVAPDASVQWPNLAPKDYSLRILFQSEP